MKRLLPVNLNGTKRSLILGVSLVSATAMAAEVPAVLPRPDTTPPSTGKVKVYILAGQSNMVGFGYLQGSQPVYPSIYLSADPDIKAGRMPVGPSALLRHGVYQAAGKDAPTAAKVEVYPGACRAGTDYSAMRPVREATVALGTVGARLPAIDGPHTVVAKAFVDVPMSGTHEIHAGFEDSAHAVVSLAGKEVYRKLVQRPPPKKLGAILGVRPQFHSHTPCRKRVQRSSPCQPGAQPWVGWQGRNAG